VDFRALWSKRLRSEAVHYAFDLIEHDGDNRRGLPLLARKRLEGNVSKRIHAPYRSGCSQTWLECKDPCRTERARGRVASVVATGRGPVPTVAIASGRLTGIISGMSWTHSDYNRPKRSDLASMRVMGVRDVLIYCGNPPRCSHQARQNLDDYAYVIFGDL
jgi:hypothetical protein